MNITSKRMPIIIAASPGGHLSQALIITANLPKRIIATYSNLKNLENEENIDAVYNLVETRTNIVFHIWNALFFIYLIIKHKPDFFVSTGGPFAVSGFIISRILRVKTIYIDTLSRVNSPSNTCKFLSKWKLSSHIFTQWPHLEDKKKGIHFIGSIIDIGDSRDTG